MDQLVSPGTMRDLCHLGSVELHFLEQARLEYSNFHSSSIYFVPSVLELILRLYGPGSGPLVEEMIRFSGIAGTVAKSPFIYLRG
jgi:hypothetical protein